MVWLLPSSQSRFAIVLIITYVIGVAGFSHIVAGAEGEEAEEAR